MKDIYLVVGHSFLSDNHLLTAVDDEVASLVKLAVFTAVNPVILVQTIKLTELRAKHDRNLANHNPCRVELTQHLFDLSLPLTSLRVHLILMPVKLLLRQRYIYEQLRRICEIPHPRLVREDRPILFVLLSNAGARVDTRLAEPNLPHD